MDQDASLQIYPVKRIGSMGLLRYTKGPIDLGLAHGISPMKLGLNVAH